MIAIPNMDKPKKGEVIAFDGENAVYTDDDMNVHRYPLIEIDDTIWENEKYKLIRMTQAVRINKEMAERRSE